MIHGMYSVRDEASAAFMPPTADLNNDTAMRNFSYALANNTMMKFKPADFSLWYVGDFDDRTGVVQAKDPLLIMRGGRQNGKK